MNNYVTSRLIRNFFRAGQAQRVYKGDIVIGFDEEPKGIYFIEEGFIKIYSISRTGEEYIHIIYGSGELFPLVWAYRRILRPVFYEALDESLLFRVPQVLFSNFSKSNVEASNALALQLAQQFYVYGERIDNLEYKTPAQRTAYRLLFLAGRFGDKENQEVTINAPFTHQLIADTINLARETVSRELESFEHQHLITRYKHHIVIQDLQGLKNILGPEFDIKGWGL
jgi:CRP-like cAMP-binding protein